MKRFARLLSVLGLSAVLTIGSNPFVEAQINNPPTGIGTVTGGSCSTHQFTSSISTTGVPSCAQPAFSDLSSSASCAQLPALTGSVTSSAGTCGTSPGGATLQAQPADPTGTTSTSFVMMGLGSTCTITPTGSTRIFLEIKGTASNSSTGGVTVRARYGTGTAPLNAAANSGTLVGANQFLNTSGGIQTGSLTFVVGGVVTGLTKNTAIWIDTSMEANGTGTATITGVVCTAFEI